MGIGVERENWEGQINFGLRGRGEAALLRYDAKRPR